MKSLFTRHPLPWRVTPNAAEFANCPRSLGVIDADGWTVTRVGMSDDLVPTPEEREKAALFAAAPKLLEQLILCSDILESYAHRIEKHLDYDTSYGRGVIDQARALITEANPQA